MIKWFSEFRFEKYYSLQGVHKPCTMAWDMWNVQKCKFEGVIVIMNNW